MKKFAGLLAFAALLSFTTGAFAFYGEKKDEGGKLFDEKKPEGGKLFDDKKHEGGKLSGEKKDEGGK